MKLSTRGRYGLKVMYQLAVKYGEGPIPLNAIAEKESLSQNYLEQLVSILRKEKLVNSVRGAQGGYMLARPPETITVGNILRVLEGDMAPADCVVEGNHECDNEEDCVTKLVWTQMKDSIDNVIDSITLEDMINDMK